MESKKPFYRPPRISCLPLSLAISFLASFVEADASVEFENLDDGGDFVWL